MTDQCFDLHYKNYLGRTCHSFWLTQEFRSFHHLRYKNLTVTQVSQRHDLTGEILGS